MSMKTLTVEVTCDECGHSIVVDKSQLCCLEVVEHIESLGWTPKWKHEPSTWWSRERSYRVGELCPDCSAQT